MKKLLSICILVLAMGTICAEDEGSTMKNFDENYVLLKGMYRDTYFPKFLVDKVKALVVNVVHYLESGETDKKKIQNQLDKMVIGINDLQDEFFENESEIETAARESIGETVEYILKWFTIDIHIEEAIQARDW